MSAEPATVAAPATIYLRDYRAPDFLVDRVELDLRLDPARTRVEARLWLRRNGRHRQPLVLDGEELDLLSLDIDGQQVAPERIARTADRLTIAGVPDSFVLDTTVVIRPEANTRLEGLYLSRGIYCTQCEAEGFRRITFFPDRPDVMARFRTRIAAPRAVAPVLLGNGNPVESGALEGGWHYAVWDDPFPKPSYLFAIVAGDLVAARDRFVTRSGRTVDLAVWVEPGNLARTGHALAALKAAMAWDEAAYGCEYDLDVFNIVAVADFNMGAMENKGLNIFNAKYVLADPDTATDDDYVAIESVVAHEYFHNWTGNRVTCRDWFQLSLKEGLTVFRDQQFSADMGSAAVKRIADVDALKRSQFAEDAGPTAHPVRPDSYIEINNFYTPTVYEKGAELIRMLHTLAGPERYRRGTDLYFRRHDGQAVTTEDFVRAIEDGAGLDLGRFRRWYTQAGTPELTAATRWDRATGTLTLTLRQATPPTPGQPVKEPVVIPVALGLVGPDGRDRPVTLAGERRPGPTTRVIALTEAEQSFTFTDLPERPVPSLLRGFSAPVKLDSGLGRGDLLHLFRHDSDLFNRWEAGQQLATGTLMRMIGAWRQGQGLEVDADVIEAYRFALADAAADRAARARLLGVPSEAALAQRMAVVDVEAIHAARWAFRRALATALRPALLEGWRALGAPPNLAPKVPDDSAAAIGRRALRNRLLAHLTAEADEEILAAVAEQFHGATTMTERQGALVALAPVEDPLWPTLLEAFRARHAADALTLDKWFALQALADRPDALDTVAALLRHPQFTLRNPNRLRALIGGFGSNQAHFHRADGAGYELLTDVVLQVDGLNPQAAAALLTPMRQWRRFDARRQERMRACLERIAARPGLSRDVYELVSKSLADSG